MDGTGIILRTQSPVSMWMCCYSDVHVLHTFILRHVQDLIHRLWETHAVFLCGRLGVKNQSDTDMVHMDKKNTNIVSHCWLKGIAKSGCKGFPSHHGNRLFGDQLEDVNHGDVAQPLSNRQGRRAILYRENRRREGALKRCHIPNSRIV